MTDQDRPEDLEEEDELEELPPPVDLARARKLASRGWFLSPDDFTDGGGS